MEMLTFKYDTNEICSLNQIACIATIIFCPPEFLFVKHFTSWQCFTWWHHLKSGFDYEGVGLRLDVYVDVLLQGVRNIRHPVSLRKQNSIYTVLYFQPQFCTISQLNP